MKFYKCTHCLGKHYAKDGYYLDSMGNRYCSDCYSLVCDSDNQWRFRKNGITEKNVY